MQINTAQKITPCLWFDANGEEAMNYYISIFKNSKIKNVSRYGDGAPIPKGTMLVGTFELQGVSFMILNGGPMFKFTPAISLMVSCENQEEVDYLWDHLTKGGEEQRCAWLVDKYGVSWQIVPTILGKLMSDPNPIKAGNVMKAMLQMNKIDISALEEAYRKD